MRSEGKTSTMLSQAMVLCLAMYHGSIKIATLTQRERCEAPRLPCKL
jgi:hypothetical protein